MMICTECSHKNHDSEPRCVECGHRFPDTLSYATVVIDPLPDVPGTCRSKVAVYYGQEVVLFIPMNNDLPYTRLPSRKRTTLGRSDPVSTQQPDMDLSLYDALEKGVSRIHAAIECSEDAVVITDLGSTNGTFLNTQQLISDQPHILHDRDEIRFGKLVAHILFQ